MQPASTFPHAPDGALANSSIEAIQNGDVKVSRPQSSSVTVEDASRDRLTVPSACIQCRSKHLKCDGRKPCSRCSENAFDCIYVKSRRGFKGPRRSALQSKAAHIPTNFVPTVVADAPICPLVQTTGLLSSVSPPNISTSQTSPRNVQPSSAPLQQGVMTQFDLRGELMNFESRGLPAGMDMRERCIEAFFYHFHPAHPFLLPRANFMALRKERSLIGLEAAIQYVGSFYVEHAPTLELAGEAERLMQQTDSVRDAFEVQALLVLAIGLDGYTYQDKALQILIEAQTLALELGMNRRDFATLNGTGSSFLEESWRRTWWELYIIDGMIAGVHQNSTFRLNEIPADVALPCEEHEYSSGRIPSPRTLQDFDEDEFSEQSYNFSSFTYRIAAIRNLGRVLASPVRHYAGADELTIDRVDAHLVNWRLHLPECKKAPITNDGQLDEMLFQAHMISEATTILLHREHSQLDSSIAKDVTSCAPHKPISPGQSYNIHAMKSIQAAQEISKLIMLPVSLAKHTHFFTCVVTLASIIHLSCWSVLLPLTHDDDLKQQLRLNTGALKGLWQVWPSAGKAFGQVKGVAAEIYSSKRRAAEIAFGDWTNLSETEVLQSINNDRIILEDLELM